MTALVILFVVGLFIWVLNQSESFSEKGAPVTRVPSARGLESFTTRIERGKLDPADSSSVEIFRVMAAGPFPVLWSRQCDFVTSVFDVTDGEPKFVLSLLEAVQEPDSIVFQHRVAGSVLRPGFAFLDWVQVGVVIPSALQPPRGGTRKLRIATRIVDVVMPPDIELGFSDPDHPGLVWLTTVDESFTFTGKGYLEVSEHEREARVLALQIGVSVAMADRSLDEREGSELKRWAEKSIHHLQGDAREVQRRALNSALTDAFAKAKAGALPLPPLLRRLKEVGDDKGKYEALDLCFDIMAADGVATEQEMKALEEIAAGLELDMREFSAIRDKKLLSISGGDAAERDGALTPEQLLGIDPAWDATRVQEHLKGEFRKWNNRLSALEDGQEKANAQRVLDAIAEVRKRRAG